MFAPAGAPSGPPIYDPAAVDERYDQVRLLSTSKETTWDNSGEIIGPYTTERIRQVKDAVNGGI